MKKTIKNFENKKVKNPNAIKGGGFGSGTRKARRITATRSKLQ